jgi:hypothetical protein
MDEKIENPLGDSSPALARSAENAYFDALIDNALFTYSAGEPRPDLSARILGATHALEPHQRPDLQRHPIRPWAFAAAGWLAAAAMLLVWFNARDLQIVVQPRPNATQLAQSAQSQLSPISTAASDSFKAAPEPSALHMTHFPRAIRTGVSTPRVHPLGPAEILHPIAFAPIVLAPIGNREGS